MALTILATIIPALVLFGHANVAAQTPSEADTPKESSGQLGADGRTNIYTKVYCLVVGNNKYPSALSQLRHAEDDAKDVAEVLGNDLHFEVTLLLGSEATRQRINSEFDKTIHKLKKDDDFIFYFSGHGMTTPLADMLNRKGYLIPYGTKLARFATPEDLQSQAIDAGYLANALVLSPGRHRLMLLDSCFSGYAASTGRVCTISLDMSMQKLLDEPSVQVVTAGTAADEAGRAVVYELEDARNVEIRHGVFTYALLDILRRNQRESISSIFLQLYNRMPDLWRMASASPALCLPQIRLLSKQSGDFAFVPPMLQNPASLPGPTGAKGQLVSKAADFNTPVGQDQFWETFDRLQNSNLLNDEELSRYSARFSVGDVMAGAVLVEHYGHQTNEQSQSIAFELAHECYEAHAPVDGIDFGVLALARCLKNGWGTATNGLRANNLIAQSGLRPVMLAFDAAANKPLRNLPPEESNFGPLSKMQKAFADLEVNDVVVFLPKNGTNTVFLSDNPEGTGPRSMALSLGTAYKVAQFSEGKTALRVEIAKGGAVLTGWLRASEFDSEFSTFKMSPVGFEIPGWGFTRMPPSLQPRRLQPPSGLKIVP